MFFFFLIRIFSQLSAIFKGKDFRWKEGFCVCLWQPEWVGLSVPSLDSSEVPEAAWVEDGKRIFSKRFRNHFYKSVFPHLTWQFYFFVTPLAVAVFDSSNLTYCGQAFNTLQNQKLFLLRQKKGVEEWAARSNMVELVTAASSSLQGFEFGSWWVPVVIQLEATQV